MSDRDKPQGDQRELQSALNRLERAVEDLAVTAKDEIATKAASFIEETTARLEREVGERKERSDARAEAQSEQASSRTHEFPPVREHSSSRSRRRERRAARMNKWQRPRTPGLYRDPDNQKIAGVCAGIARYWGTETWVVRCIAITGLLFMPSVVFPAYWITYFVLGNPPDHLRDQPGRHRKERVVRADQSEPSPREKKRQESARFRLRDVQSVLAQAELRLRRMETHVTSGQYELQREFKALDDQPVVRPVT